jgi:hypothetical protein
MRCEERSVSVEGRITLPDDLCELRGRKGRDEEAMQEVLLDAPRRNFSTPRYEAFELTPDPQVHCIAAGRTLKSRIKRRRAEVDMMIGLWKRCRRWEMPSEL